LAHGGSFLANFLTGPSSRQIDMMIFAAGNGNENWWELLRRSRSCFLAYRQRRAQGFWVADVGDFDGNRKSDILWVNDDGTASGMARKLIPRIGWPIPAPYRGGSHVAGIDFDGSARDDIAWQDITAVFQRATRRRAHTCYCRDGSGRLAYCLKVLPQFWQAFNRVRLR
jgi:hypothetical protein